MYDPLKEDGEKREEEGKGNRREGGEEEESKMGEEGERREGGGEGEREGSGEEEKKAAVGGEEEKEEKREATTEPAGSSELKKTEHTGGTGTLKKDGSLTEEKGERGASSEVESREDKQTCQSSRKENEEKAEALLSAEGGMGGGGKGGGGDGGGGGRGGWGWGGWGKSLWSSVSTVTESAQALGQKVLCNHDVTSYNGHSDYV